MRLTQRAENIVLPIAAVVIALLIGAVLIWLNGSNPWTAYTELVEGALGSRAGLARTLEKATPVTLTGLAVILAMKGGLFNIGAQGQLLFGATFDKYGPPASSPASTEYTGETPAVHEARARNIAALAKLAPDIGASINPNTLRSRVSYRATTPDRAPIAGLLPDAEAWLMQYADLAHGRAITTAKPPPAHNGPAFWIKVAARDDGSFTVTNARNGFSKHYAR